jgi:hypothetical protein
MKAHTTHLLWLICLLITLGHRLQNMLQLHYVPMALIALVFSNGTFRAWAAIVSATLYRQGAVYVGYCAKLHGVLLARLAVHSLDSMCTILHGLAPHSTVNYSLMISHCH